jgi:hypothetical protein
MRIAVGLAVALVLECSGVQAEPNCSQANGQHCAWVTEYTKLMDIVEPGGDCRDLAPVWMRSGSMAQTESSPPSARANDKHIAWVEENMKHMASVEPGVTRWDLARVLMWFGQMRRLQSSPVNAQATETHIAWVEENMKQMATIIPGMTRRGLLRVFTEEGGWSTRKQRTYVSRNCPYFKVSVTFVPSDESPSTPEDAREKERLDKIKSISRPYLAWSIMD